MQRNHLQFILTLILVLVSCNFANPRPVSVSTDTPLAHTNASPSIEATIPIAGDLGPGKIFGKVTDSATDAPIAGANVTCQHSSYTSSESERCNRNTTTDRDGNFLFENIF